VHQAGTDVTALMPFYVKGIRKFDTGRFRNFVSFLKSHGYMDDSLFFFFSDHGEGRNDETNMHSFGHSGPVYDDVIRVPLMIYHRDVNHGVTDRMTSIVDIFPTVLEMATGERPHADFSYRIDGANLLNDYRERPVYCETWLNDHKDKHWNLEMTSYLLYQRALRDRSRKYVIYGVPEKFQDGKYEGSDEDFLRDYYRGYRYRFESYNEFVEKLKILNKNPSARAEMLGKVDARFLCYFDLATDPDELTPIFVDSALNSGNGNLFQTLLSISSRSSEALNIFDEIESTYLEDIAGKLLAIDQKTTIRFLAQNKHLLNEMTDRILLDSRLSDREFIMLIHEIFLRRTPTEREIDEGEELIRQGVTRRRYFNNVIFNNRVFGNLKTFAAAKTELHDLLELSEYKRKYEEIQESLIFRCFRKTAFLIDNVLCPQYTRRRTLLMHVLKKFRTDK
jgi:hypothetical protein